MPSSAIELFAELAGSAAPGTILDARVFAEDPGFAERAERVIAADAEIVFTAPGGTGGLGEMGGPFTGPEGFIAGWAEWMSSWEEWRFTIKEMVEVGDRLLALSDTFGRLAGSALVLEQPAAGVFTAADGRFVRIESFFDQDDARRAAGLG